MAQRKAPAEFALIARAFAPLATQPGAFGLRDDAAIVPHKTGRDLVVTKDAIVEGVHFLSEDRPDLVARKLLRVNLSDLAAKGARPFGYLLAAAFPKSAPAAYATSFARGLAKDQATYGLSLFGGDTVATPGPTMFVCTMFGYAPRGRMVRRSGAKPGDDVWVTGTLGDSGAGLALLRKQTTARGPDAEWLKGRYRLPDPPVAFGCDASPLMSAALDVSDGLAQDAGHLARESGVKLTLQAQSLPLSPKYRRVFGDSLDAILAAATAGDDYQIVFTAPPRRRTAIEALARKHILRVSRIGVAGPGRGVVIVNDQGRAVTVHKTGYTHF